LSAQREAQTPSTEVSDRDAESGPGGVLAEARKVPGRGQIQNQSRIESTEKKRVEKS
jgi:hypothetical protein